MFSIPGHKENVNQNYVKISARPSQKKKRTNIGEDVREKEPLYTVGKNGN
jgi:hypothetical protein